MTTSVNTDKLDGTSSSGGVKVITSEGVVPEKPSIFSGLREKFASLSNESKELFDRRVRKSGSVDSAKMPTSLSGGTIIEVVKETELEEWNGKVRLGEDGAATAAEEGSDVLEGADNYLVDDDRDEAESGVSGGRAAARAVEDTGSSDALKSGPPPPRSTSMDLPPPAGGGRERGDIVTDDPDDLLDVDHAAASVRKSYSTTAIGIELNLRV